MKYNLWVNYWGFVKLLLIKFGKVVNLIIQLWKFCINRHKVLKCVYYPFGNIKYIAGGKLLIKNCCCKEIVVKVFCNNMKTFPGIYWLRSLSDILHSGLTIRNSRRNTAGSVSFLLIVFCGYNVKKQRVCSCCMRLYNHHIAESNCFMSY